MAIALSMIIRFVNHTLIVLDRRVVWRKVGLFLAGAQEVEAVPRTGAASWAMRSHKSFISSGVASRSMLRWRGAISLACIPSGSLASRSDKSALSDSR